jgi:hydroxymethylbilane synthase
MDRVIRIGTRDSQLAVWQATLVKNLLLREGVESELVYIKSEGDIDLKTPLYEMGVQGIFTRSLDIALLNNRIDLAVHSMKDVPTKFPAGIVEAAILERGPVHDLLVFKKDGVFLHQSSYVANIATSSIRRKAQWLHKFPHHQLHNLRGNVNTRLKKLQAENWDAAIFAQAGLERINLRPTSSEVLDWMLPAPAQGAIIVVCRKEDDEIRSISQPLNHKETALCTNIEKGFLRILAGGCSTPISAYAQVRNETVYFKGNLFSLDGKEKCEVEKEVPIGEAETLGEQAGLEILRNGGERIAEKIRNAS